MIAPGADQILQIRRGGKRPGSDVVVSLIGALPVDFLVQADADTDYDWIMLVDLKVWVVASSKTRRLDRLLWSMRDHRPKQILLWLDDKQAGYELHFWPSIESITRPPDKWDWKMERSPMLKWENQVIGKMFQGMAA